MLRLASDENYNGILIRRLRQEFANLDLIRAQEVGLSGSSDPQILEWAAHKGRILLTHDIATMTVFAYERVNKGLPMPGVFASHADASLEQVFDSLAMILQCSTDDDWKNLVTHLPL